jgi:SAM-dependent methyltransferase
LAALHAERLPTDGVWLDLGCGDGNLARSLGGRRVVAIDYQPELVRLAPDSALRVVGSAIAVPLAGGTADVALVMDVLHHLPPDALRPVLAELRRVLRSDGTLLVWEPTQTWVRRGLQLALSSPLAALTEFSRQKRRLVEEEWDTLAPWLDAERSFPDVARAAGFVVEHAIRGPMHGAHRLRPAASPSGAA